MPVEIKELQINVTVNQQNAGAAGASGPTAPDTNGDDKKAMINQCIEQVIEIFNNKKER
jgi:hypothetical protein